MNEASGYFVFYPIVVGHFFDVCCDRKAFTSLGIFLRRFVWPLLFVEKVEHSEGNGVHTVKMVC